MRKNLCFLLFICGGLSASCSKSSRSDSSTDSGGPNPDIRQTSVAGSDVAQRAAMALVPELTCSAAVSPVTPYISSIAAAVKYSFPAVGKTSTSVPSASDVAILSSAVTDTLVRVPKPILDSFQLIQGEIFVLPRKEVTERCLAATNSSKVEGQPEVEADTAEDLPYCAYYDYEIADKKIRGRQIILLADGPNNIRKGLPELLAGFYTRTFLRTEKILTEDGKRVQLMNLLPLGEKPSQGIHLRDTMSVFAKEIQEHPLAYAFFDMGKYENESAEAWLDRLSIRHGAMLLNFYMCPPDFTSDYLVQSSLKDAVTAASGKVFDEKIDSRRLLAIFFPKTFAELTKLFPPQASKSAGLNLIEMFRSPSPGVSSVEDYPDQREWDYSHKW